MTVKTILHVSQPDRLLSVIILKKKALRNNIFPAVYFHNPYVICYRIESQAY